MIIRNYSYNLDGNKYLSKNFKVYEFRCKDGSDTIKIADELIKVLQDISDTLNKPCIIISGYRTESYNKSIGGAKYSQHMIGSAADIILPGIEPRKVAEIAESMSVGGIGLYEYKVGSGFVHVDVRESRARWLKTSPGSPDIAVASFNTQEGKTIKGIVNTASSRLNVRQQPNVISKIIDRLPKGTIVEITGETGNWYKIKLNSMEGYVYASYIKLIN